MGPVEKKRSKRVEVGFDSSVTQTRPKRVVGAKKDGAGPKGEAPAARKRVRDYKNHAKKELSEAFPAIVGALVERAKGGSLTHAKLLFEIGGVKDKPVSPGSRQEQPSLAKLLLQEVAKRREEATELCEADGKSAQ